MIESTNHQPQQRDILTMLNDGAATVGLRQKKKRGGKASPNKTAELDFEFQIKAHKLPIAIKQFELLKTVQKPRKDGKHIPNKWKFDFVFEQYNLIVEIDGGIWMVGGGAHSHPLDIVRNMEKRNDAAYNGFFIISFTPDQVKKGTAIAETIRFLVSHGWKR